MNSNLINYYLINVTFPPNFSIFSLAEFEIKFVSISNFSFISPDPSNFNLLYFLFTSWNFCKVNRFNLLLGKIFFFSKNSCILDKLIIAIGIRHIGHENAKTLAKYFINIKKFEELFDEKKRKKILNYFLELDGIGETQVKSLETFFSNSSNLNTVSNLIKELNVTDFKTSKSGIFYGKTIMFTGGLSKMSRAEAKALVEKEGGKILGAASKKLDYLVVGDSKPTSKKVEKAKQLNIKILDENSWYGLLNRWTGIN